jgi:hypothetical protein
MLKSKLGSSGLGVAGACWAKGAARNNKQATIRVAAKPPITFRGRGILPSDTSLSQQAFLA